MAAALAALLVFLAAASDSAIESAAKALDQEDYAKAAELLEKVVADEPDNHNARFNLAFAYTEIKQLGKAIGHYEIVVRQQPELTSARVNLSSLLMQQGEFSRADWIIDLGPEGGEGGGQIVVEGTPEQVVACAESHTGRYLAKFFDEAD